MLRSFFLLPPLGLGLFFFFFFFAEQGRTVMLLLLTADAYIRSAYNFSDHFFVYTEPHSTIINNSWSACAWITAAVKMLSQVRTMSVFPVIAACYIPFVFSKQNQLQQQLGLQVPHLVTTSGSVFIFVHLPFESRDGPARLVVYCVCDAGLFRRMSCHDVSDWYITCTVCRLNERFVRNFMLLQQLLLLLFAVW